MGRADRPLIGERARGERLDGRGGDGDEDARLDDVEPDRALECEGAPVRAADGLSGIVRPSTAVASSRPKPLPPRSAGRIAVPAGI